jgi:hypothetical protein
MESTAVGTILDYIKYDGNIENMADRNLSIVGHFHLLRSHFLSINNNAVYTSAAQHGSTSALCKFSY